MIIPYPHPIQEKDGKPYHVKNGFTCKAQVDRFQELLQSMAENPRTTSLQVVAWQRTQ